MINTQDHLLRMAPRDNPLNLFINESKYSCYKSYIEYRIILIKHKNKGEGKKNLKLDV